MNEASCASCGAMVPAEDDRCPSCGDNQYGTGTMRRIGSVLLDLYEVSSVLGQGGMSVVYKGVHKITGQEVALKILPPEMAAFREVKQRFIEEGKALAKLDHPNIIHLYNFGEDAGCFVLAMQFVAGATWEDKIFEAERLPWRRSLEICRDVLRGLDFAHSHGVIHRDMKPSNVLIRDSDESVRITDFGIAKTQGSSKLTATGQTMGTVRYMSPEQVRGETVDLRTDIYSTAATLFESLVGDSPFGGNSHFEIMMAHLKEAPLPPSECGVDLPLAVDRLVLRGLAKDREDRPESAAKYLAMVEAALRGDSVEGETRALFAKGGTQPSSAGGDAATEPSGVVSPATSSTGAGERAARGKPALWIALAALVVVGGAGALYALSSGEDGAAPGPSATASESADKVETPPFYHLPGLKLPAHRALPDRQLEIHGPEDADFDAVTAQVDSARAAYREFLAAGGVEDEVEDERMAVVLAPPSAFCDRRLYEGGRPIPPDCDTKTVWYRPEERTAYVRLEGGGSPAAGAIREAVALATCLHQNLPGCAESLDGFLAKSTGDLDDK